MILVVDDDENIRAVLQAALEMDGHVVSTARNGQEALASLASEPIPDLILLDLMMPVMNGWDFLAILRGSPSWSTIPVIVISAVPDPALPYPQVRGMLRKPMDLGALLGATNNYRGKAA